MDLPAGIAQPPWRQSATTLVILSLVNILSMADRVLLGIVTEPVKHELALSDTQMSLANGLLFVAFNLIAGLFIAHWVDRSHRKRILVIGLATWTIATAMTGMAHNFAVLALSRTLIGAGEATVFPVAISMIADLYRPAARPRVVGIFQASAFIGLVGGSILAGVLSALHGWRTMFMLFGASGLVLLLLILLFMIEPKRTGIALETGEAVSAKSRTLWAEIPAILRIPGFTLLGLGLGSSAMGVSVLAVWAPAFLQRSHGIGLAEVGAVTGPAIGIGGISGTILSGIAASWLVKRQGKDSVSLLIPIIALPLAVPCFVLFVMASSLALAMTAAGLMNFLLSAAMAPCIALSVAMVGSERRGLASTLLLFANGIIGGALAPLLVGILSDALMPTLGSEALRYAILSTAPSPFIAALLLVRARSRMSTGRGGVST